MKRFIFGYLACIFTLAACGAIQYRYYGLMVPDPCYSEGKLVGPPTDSSWPSLSLTQCQPDDVTKGKCVVQLTEDFFKKDDALLKCQSDLAACQKAAQ